MSDTTNNNNNNKIKATTRPSNLSAPCLLNCSPSHHGPALKLHIPLVYDISPKWLQTLLLTLSCSCSPLRLLLSPLIPSWRHRYLISVGNFFYRYSTSHSSEPKGSPTPLASISHLSPFSISRLDTLTIPDLPPSQHDWQGFLSLQTSLHKTNYYAFPTEQDASTWMHALHEGRQSAISRSMGHAQHVPHPPSWECLDRMGEALRTKKERIKERIRRAEEKEREVEMISFTSGNAVGVAPRMVTGYYS